MCSAGLKVMNSQNRTEPIRLFNISYFPSIVKGKLAVLQQRVAARKTAESRIAYDNLWQPVFFNAYVSTYFSFNIYFKSSLL